MERGNSAQSASNTAAKQVGEATGTHAAHTPPPPGTGASPSAAHPYGSSVADTERYLQHSDRATARDKNKKDKIDSTGLFSTHGPGQIPKAPGSTKDDGGGKGPPGPPPKDDGASKKPPVVHPKDATQPAQKFGTSTIPWGSAKGPSKIDITHVPSKPDQPGPSHPAKPAPGTKPESGHNKTTSIGKPDPEPGQPPTVLAQDVPTADPGRKPDAEPGNASGAPQKIGHDPGVDIGVAHSGHQAAGHQASAQKVAHQKAPDPSDFV